MTSGRDHGYDLVVIGAGSAGLVAADFGARFGAQVLLIEANRIGGDCTWTGCIPSKTLRETVPWAVFTDPELAQIGLTEEQARARGGDVRVHRLPLDRVDRAQTLGETDGLIKILSDASGQLLGATIVAPSASEVVNELSVAMTAGVNLQDLGSAMQVYPTMGIGIQQLASDFAVGKAAEGVSGAVSRLLTRRSRR